MRINLDADMPRPVRKPTNLSLDSELVSAARELNVNVSRAAEEGIERAVRIERERIWRQEMPKQLCNPTPMWKRTACR